MKTNRILVVAGVSLALAFVFSCSSDSDDDSPSPHSSSSDSENFSTVCDIKGYKTVEIDGLNWMAENLNCNIKGSKCYDNDPANCEKYGRLYNWATAMDFPSSCNSNSCANQILPVHRGICPEGWHIPSIDDWVALVVSVGGIDNAGTKLKAKNGWSDKITLPYEDEHYYIPGTNDYGFSALPGGIGGGGGFSNAFSMIGEWGWFWRADEYSGDGFGGYSIKKDAGYIGMFNDRSSVEGSIDGKKLLISVRCLQDFELPPIGSGCDIKDYKTAEIGGKTWMAENLKCNVSGSKCFGACKKYGRLYDWATAMDLPPNCNSEECKEQIQPQHKGICPTGWHIPTSEEWDDLVEAVGGEANLKAKSGWNNNGNGTDEYKFSALPSGAYSHEKGFGGMGDIGLWWNSTEQSANAASVKLMYNPTTYFYYYMGFSKPDLLAVRCVKNYL